MWGKFLHYEVCNLVNRFTRRERSHGPTYLLDQNTLHQYISVIDIALEKTRKFISDTIITRALTVCLLRV